MPASGRAATPSTIAAFYAYAYPAPEGFAAAPVRPEAAFFHQALGEFILPYDAVREADAPEAMLLDFLQTTYEAAANAAGWDRAELGMSAGPGGGSAADRVRQPDLDAEDLLPRSAGPCRS